MLYNVENIALQISQILYIFVLRAEICTTFEPKVVQISARNTLYTKFAKFAGLNFRHFKTWGFCGYSSFLPQGMVTDCVGRRPIDYGVNWEGGRCMEPYLLSGHNKAVW